MFIVVVLRIKIAWGFWTFFALVYIWIEDHELLELRWKIWIAQILRRDILMYIIQFVVLRKWDKTGSYLYCKVNYLFKKETLVFVARFIAFFYINSRNNNVMSIKNQSEQYVFHGQFSFQSIVHIYLCIYLSPQ